jgi:hypothetical protein
MLLCVLVLTGCQSAKKKTVTPAAPAHNVPPAVYPAPKTGNPADAGQASQPYPAPLGNSFNAPYPAPGISATSPTLTISVTSTPVTNQYAPAPGDDKLIRGTAFVDMTASRMILLETAPHHQVKLHLIGTLPNPCYKLRVNPAQPNDQNDINVEVYSVTKPGQVCTEVIQDFDVEIPLGSFTGGHFTFLINGIVLGYFTG